MPTVDAYRAGSRVDFSRAGCCVAPPRSSLPLSKRYLSRSSPLCMYFRYDKDSSRFGICQYNVDFQDLGLVVNNAGTRNVVAAGDDRQQPFLKASVLHVILRGGR